MRVSRKYLCIKSEICSKGYVLNIYILPMPLDAIIVFASFEYYTERTGSD